jgi:hypothetical protein
VKALLAKFAIHQFVSDFIVSKNNETFFLVARMLKGETIIEHTKTRNKVERHKSSETASEKLFWWETDCSQ